MGKKRSLITTDAGSRKARRKDERLAKKKNRGAGQVHHHPSKHEEEPLEKKVRKTKKSNESENEVSMKSMSILKKESKYQADKKSDRKTQHSDDPYAHLDPDVAAAMRADDAEIAMLEERLALSSGGGSKGRGKDKLYKEYAKLEGFGDSFGGFLEDLDRIAAGRDLHEKGDIRNGSFDLSDDEPTYASDSGSDEESSESEAETSSNRSDDDSEESGLSDEEMQNENVVDKAISHMNRNQISSDDKQMNCDESNSDDESDGSVMLEDNNVNQSSSQSDSEQSKSDATIGNDDEEITKHVYRPTAGEDIYGNKIENDASDVKPTKYIPPHLRNKMNASLVARNESVTSIEANTINRCLSDKATLSTINRKLNGMLNRLSEETLDSVSKQLIGLYRESSVNDVNSCLLEKMKQACVHSSQIMKSLIPTFCALLAAVHIHVGNDVGGFLLESLVTNFMQTQQTARGSISIDEDGYSKECSNLILIMSYLYNFQVVHCTLMYDIIRDLIESFCEVDVELLLLLLSHCGFQLRSDDPTALKDIVLLVQKRAIDSSKGSMSKEQQSSPSSSRVSYMIEAITDLKNNKKRKNDETRLEKTAKYKKFVGRMKSEAFSNNPSGDSCMRVTLQDILDIERKGRWWKVGASWVGNQYNTEDGSERINSFDAASSEAEKKLLKLAAKQHMNTDSRRSIFCILMNSADCDDAFEKLVRLNLKGKQDREIVRVLVHCCGQEKSYNPFYAFLAVRLCEFQSKAKFTFQLSFWDFFKQLDDKTKTRKAANMGKLLAHLVFENVLSIMVLKALDMSTLSENGIIFVTILITQLFGKYNDAFQVAEVFASIPREDPEGIALRDGLSVFLQRYLKKHPSNKKNSHFRSCFKVVVKACEDDLI